VPRHLGTDRRRCLQASKGAGSQQQKPVGGAWALRRLRMEMLSWCFPCCCPPATSSLVTSELKLIEEPRSIRPGFRQRLQSDNEDDPGLCSDSEVLDPGATSAGSPAFRAAGSGSLPQRSDKLMLLGSQAKRSAGEEQRSLRSAGGEVGKADEHRAATKNQRKAGWEDGRCSASIRPPARPVLLPRPWPETGPLCGGLFSFLGARAEPVPCSTYHVSPPVRDANKQRNPLPSTRPSLCPHLQLSPATDWGGGERSACFPLGNASEDSACLCSVSSGVVALLEFEAGAAGQAPGVCSYSDDRP
jgi:hypothetical protein